MFRPLHDHHQAYLRIKLIDASYMLGSQLCLKFIKVYFVQWIGRQVLPFHRPRKPLGRVEVQLYSVLDLCSRRGEGSASRSGRTLPRGKTRYPLHRRLGGPQGRSGQVQKISPHRDSIPGPSRAQAVAIPTTLPGLQYTYIYIYIYLFIFRSGDETEKNEMSGVCSTYGERRGIYRVLEGKPQRKRSF